MESQPSALTPIYCTTESMTYGRPHGMKKLLAKTDATGIWLYCKECRKEHYYTWEQLAALRAAVPL